jgi:membrane-associated PAP2 superfamily phosphatase
MRRRFLTASGAISFAPAWFKAPRCRASILGLAPVLVGVIRSLAAGNGDWDLVDNGQT